MSKKSVPRDFAGPYRLTAISEIYFKVDKTNHNGFYGSNGIAIKSIIKKSILGFSFRFILATFLLYFDFGCI